MRGCRRCFESCQCFDTGGWMTREHLACVKPDPVTVTGWLFRCCPRPSACGSRVIITFQMMLRWGTGWRSALRRYWTRRRSRPSQRRCSIPTRRTRFCLKQSTLSFTWTVTPTCWYEHAISSASSCSIARPICGMLLRHDTCRIPSIVWVNRCLVSWDQCAVC